MVEVHCADGFEPYEPIPYISGHGEERMRKRLGLPRRAAQRTAEKALKDGATHGQFTGSFKRYLDSVFFSNPAINNLRVHAGTLYLFANETLVTCWQVPTKYRSVRAHAAA